MTRDDKERLAESITIAFHDTYEGLAADFGWETQTRSRVPWDQVPEANRQLMCATVDALLEAGIIR